MSSISETVFTGRDNAIEWALSIDGTVIDHTEITRALLTVDGSTVIDSSVTPSAFSFGNADRVILYLGLVGLSAGYHTAFLTIFDATTVNGLTWSTEIMLDVT